MTDQPQSPMGPPPEGPGYEPPPPPSPSFESPPPPPMGMGPTGGDISDNDRLMAALAYAIPGLVSLIILVSEQNKQRPFQRFHAIQALVADAAVWIVMIAASCILGSVVGVVTLGLGTICGCLPFVLVVLPLYWAYQAYQGKYFDIPVVTQFIRDQKWV